MLNRRPLGRPRGAPSPTPALRFGRSVFPVGIVLAILAAAIGGIALASSMRTTSAAEIPGAITEISITEESSAIWGRQTIEIEWAVPDSATEGDTFGFTLPDELERTLNTFQLRAPDGQVVAVVRITGRDVVFTLTDYVDDYNNVSGTAFFQTTFTRSEVTENGPVTVEFLTFDGVTYTDTITVTGVSTGPGTTTPTNRELSRKSGWWVRPLDQGVEEPEGAINFRLESAWGPASTVLFEDTIGAGAAIDCDSVQVLLATEFDENNRVVTIAPADPSTYTVACTPATLEVTAGPLADEDLFRVNYTASITDQDVETYTNDAKVTMDGVPQTKYVSVRRSTAGGNGSGNLTPGITLAKYGTDAGPTDGDADAAPGQNVGNEATSVTMTITNSGDEALEDVTVSDTTDDGADLAGLSCDFSPLGGPATGTTWAGPFAVDASFDCTGTLPAMAGGTTHADTGSVTATGVTSGTTVTDDDPWHAHNPDSFDLALRKTLAEGQSATVQPLDTVDFTIEVFNQGSITAANVEITDYLPTGMSLADPDWTDNGDGTATTVIAGPLAPEASTTVDLTLQLQPGAVPGQLDNRAEISAATDAAGGDVTDVDSIPDTDVDNDALVDDEIDSTADGDPADEDDHDIASVTLDDPVFDLALRKVLADGQPSLVDRGDTVDFTIEVFNQGNVSASNVELTDTLPPDTTLADDDWVDGDDGTATIMVPGPLAPGESTTVDITVRLDEGVAAGTRTNLAEISDADPAIAGLDDIDSTPDGDSDNDVVTDDEIDSTPDGDPADEDDHDPAPFEVTEFDLALRKTLADGQSSTVEPRATVDFTIEVFNQGDVTATNITVIDHLANGMILADDDWTDGDDGTATIVVPGPLAPGESTTVDITVRLTADADDGSLRNLAEISSATDEDGKEVPDVDSTPDADPDDDALVDDEIDSTPEGDPSDEDDHDIAEVVMDAPVFDLALRKTTEADLVRVGDVVDFTIEVFNQGNLAATDIVVADTIPAELAFAADGNDGWELTDGVAFTTIDGPLAPGASTEVTISLEVIDNAEVIVNDAEIAAALDPEGNPVTDVDSAPDADATNDELVDDEIDSNPTGDPADEDDHDIAPLRAPSFDLALRKVLAEGQVARAWPGDSVAFTIQVFNQGQQAATDIVVTDELPEGLAFDAESVVNIDAGWALADGQLTTTLAGPLAPGESTTVDLVATIGDDVRPGDLVNTAEISAATDETGGPAIDIDSTPDTDLDDDALVDDEIDSTPEGEPSDEDDHDIAELNVPEVDLALRKQLADGQAREVAPGSMVDFTITVFNQGDIAVTDVSVADTLPPGLAFVASANDGWSEADGVVTTTIDGPLEPGGEVELRITLEVTASFGESIVNDAEITGQSGPDGTPRPDVDSTPDGDPTNDELTDDEIDGTPETGDEDDHDIAEVVTSSRQTEDDQTDGGGSDTRNANVDRGSNGRTSVDRGALARTGASLLGVTGLGIGLVALGFGLLNGRRIKGGRTQ